MDHSNEISRNLMQMRKEKMNKLLLKNPLFISLSFSSTKISVR